MPEEQKKTAPKLTVDQLLAKMRKLGSSEEGQGEKRKIRARLRGLGHTGGLGEGRGRPSGKNAKKPAKGEKPKGKRAKKPADVSQTAA